MPKTKKVRKVAVAMSGGVDSSVAAAMMVEQGFEVIGLTMQLYDHGKALQKKGACCAGSDINDARSVAYKLGIPHYVLNYETLFQGQVMEDFADAYLKGQTPIPCVKCNQTVKFTDMFDRAKKLGASAMATGHYIRRKRKFGNIVKFENWHEVEKERENADKKKSEGLMIKRIVTKYEKGRVTNSWFKWKKEPYIIDFVLMYAQRGHGKRSSFYSDFTFGCWVDNTFDKLVPIGKAYSGFSNEELNQLDKWVRNNTLERFGPVRSLKSKLVVEISFDNINHSDRHKSGVALRFPRFSRIRWDKPANEVCILKDIKSLIN